MNGEPVLLEVEDLSVDFELRGVSINAIQSVSLKVSAGETVGIVGESGSGKSVTSLAIMGLIKEPGFLRSGVVRIFGEDMLKLSRRQRRKYLGRDISMIFQEPTESLNPVFSIAQQIDEVLKSHGSMNHEQRTDRVLELMKIVGMPEPEKTLRSWPHQLSGGMNQRVMIAMAIACNPSLLIADEPTTALDVTVQEQILKLLRRLQQENNMGLIFITHDLSVVSTIADKIIVMYAGQVVELCATDDLFQQALHPYTEALLKSLPENYSSANKRMDSIKGSQPAAGEILPGCRFQPRCNYARELCSQQKPVLNAIEEFSPRAVRCFYPLVYDSGTV
ncbi:MAG: ATP-binding cassette domain-containing protein [Gammaproteobacteria bacterium]|nr:MAG: ATP-binding cassette domain-containing protein [Gammaproteobacteria bacterium]